MLKKSSNRKKLKRDSPRPLASSDDRQFTESFELKPCWFLEITLIAINDTIKCILRARSLEIS